ncbi:hypothetical protein C8Q74DRAFT_1366301 [Fomes fomentarius]|nr:hypothetical protein C8Q74DRAFT_1366301 [Fomes fomentarius]
MPPTPYYDVYAKELSRYQLGHALWHPDPDPKHGPVRIGDVGYLNNGCFCFLFNAIDRRYNRMGHPSGCDMLHIDANTQIHQQLSCITQPTLQGSSIQKLTISADIGVNLGGGVAAGWDFESSSASGAFLLLKGHAHREYLQCTRIIKDHMKKHLPQWFKFARQHRGIDLCETDIVFVSGIVKTAVSAAVSFSHKSSKKGVSFSGHCSFPGVTLGGVGMKVESMQARYFAIDQREGPPEMARHWDTLAPEQLAQCDQCIFLEYFRKSRLRGVKEMKAAAGPHILPPPDPPMACGQVMSFDDGEIISEQEYLQEESGEVPSKPFDLLGTVLDYMLARSGADIACVSHADLASIVGKRNTPSDTESWLELLSPRLSTEVTASGLRAAYLSLSVDSTETAHTEGRTEEQVTPS